MDAKDVNELTRELRNVIANTEQVLRATAGDVGEKAAEARVRAERSLKAARKRLRRSEERVVRRARVAARRTDRYVHANPWNAIGLTAAVAFILGCLAVRR